MIDPRLPYPVARQAVAAIRGATIYLCGAINGCDDRSCKDWRERVKHELGDAFRFLDPMRRDYRGSEREFVAEIVNGDYDDIVRSQILLVAADRPSWGTAMEVHQAFMSGDKFIVAICAATFPSPWLVYHTHRLEPTLDRAIAFLRTLPPA